MDTIIVYTTVPGEAIAEKIADTLINERLIACANFYPVKSHYWWKGKLEEQSEVMVIMKTLREKYQEIEKRIRDLHGYETPEILAIDVISGYYPYLQWVEKTVMKE
jgi:periplasmic divalent cation tolerance protein